MKTMKNILAAFLPFAVAAVCVAVPPPAGTDIDRILDAIQKVETGGEADPANAVGDNGKAIGPMQIHRSYWKDAVQFDPSIGGTYADCRDEDYARRIVVAYMTRYAPDWNVRIIARIHNGGPRGHKNPKTVNYANKVFTNYQKSDR
jgi:hypothetical protein